MNKRRQYIKDNKLKTTYTNIFLLPALGFNKKFYDSNFIEVYLIDVLKPKLALIFDNKESEEELKECIFILQNHENYVDSYFDDDNREIVIIIDFPNEFKDDFLNFKKGRYTRFSKEYKNLLLEIHGSITGDGKYITVIDALYPDYKAKKYQADKFGVSVNDLPNGEVQGIPDMDLELYKKVDELYNIKSK